MKKKLIIFDLDGTILDTKYDLYNSFKIVSEKYKLKDISIDEFVSHLGRGLTVLFNEIVLDQLDDITKAKAFSEYICHYKNNCTLFTIPYNGIVKVIDTLKDKGYLLSVVSNKNDLMVKTIINHFYKDKFIFFTGAKEGYRKKPEPDLINLALDTLKMRIEDTIYIGDSKYDILTARNLKMDSIIVSYGYGKKEDLLSYNPSIIIDNPLDILIYL